MDYTDWEMLDGYLGQRPIDVIVDTKDTCLSIYWNGITDIVLCTLPLFSHDEKLKEGKEYLVNAFWRN